MLERKQKHRQACAEIEVEQIIIYRSECAFFILSLSLYTDNILEWRNDAVSRIVHARRMFVYLFVNHFFRLIKRE